jgi:amino acid adenylation domain-containing protein
MPQPLASSNHSNVSVIIPAYNSSEFLPAAIESVINQTYPAEEIVVVDDGSIDDTKAVCDRYPSVKYIYQSNQGYLVARNTGIAASQSEYLIFLDSDDYLYPDAIEIGINEIKDRPEAGFVFGRYLFRAINPDRSYSTQKLFEEPPPVASYATILAAQHNIQCATVIFRRSAVESVGRFAPKLEDVNLWLGIARAFPIYFHDRVVSEYRYHGGNFSSKSAKMLASTLHTLSLEWDYIQQTGDLELIAAYERGRSAWIKFYGDRILYEVVRLAQAGVWIEALGKLRFIFNCDPQLSCLDREAYAAATEALSQFPIEAALTALPLFTQTSNQITKAWVYNPDRFDRLTIDRLNEYFYTLAPVEMLDRSVVELPPLTATQRHQLLVEWNATQTDYPRTKCIHQLFEEQVELTGEAIALAFEQHQLTYRELNQRANQVAHYLITLGVKADDLVGIAIDRSLETIIGILGILKAGGAYLPLDLAYPAERISLMLTDAQVSIILTHTDLVDRLPSHQAQIICLDRDQDQLATFSTTNPQSLVNPDQLAYVMYTSGSTGQPKGVCVPHRGVVRLVKGTNYIDFGSDRVFLQLAPISFDAATFEIWGGLLNGAKLVLFPGNQPSLSELGQVIKNHQVTTLWLTAGLFQLMVDERIEDLQPLQQLIAGGDVLSVPHVQKVLSTLTNCQLINGYGPTENTTFTCCHLISKSDTFLTSIPIGRPIANTQVYILDSQLEPVSIGSAGELYIGGDGLARGYLNRPDLTAAKFVPNPFDEGEKLYRTGDLVRHRPDGTIEFLGRIDDQVKIRGFRIEPGEAETALSQHPNVREVKVIAREDAPGDKRLVAYVVPASQNPFGARELRDYLQPQLPEYTIPSAFVYLAAMPLTPNGKIDRHALPAPDRASLIDPKIDPKFVAAGTVTGATEPFEQILAEIWTEVLKLPQVGIEDNFFDLGGNSLLGLKAIDRIQSRFNLKVAVVRLYQYSSIRSMAAYLDQATSGHQPIAMIDRPAPSNRSTTNPGVAVIGMVGRFPGANSIEELWDNLCAGTESITFFDQDDLDPSLDPELTTDPNYVRAKGIMQGAELFDAGFFGIAPREAEVMDPQARILMELAYEALENAGYPATEHNKIGVYAGSAQNTYLDRNLRSRPEIIDRFGEFQAHLVNDRDYFTTRTSYKLNLQGPSINISTACSTSLVAIIQAYQGLLNHQCDLALAGGVAISTPQNQGYLHQEGAIFTPDGHCRPFDARAEGTLFNNGGAIVVLKRLDEAIADGDRIYTVIKGVGINNDGADKVSFTAPSVSGQMGAILQAQQEAGIEPESISYIEAHGTATALGDPIEVEALTQAFRTQTQAKQFCGIGSIKSNLGHLTAAAGVAGFIKTVLALYHRQIPPSINFDQPNPHIDFANSPFYVNHKLVEWQSGDTPRRAGVSSFGGGGTNAHVILEEPPQISTASPTRPYQLLLLSGKTATAIDRLTSNLHTYLQQDPDLNLADVAYTLQQGRKTFSQRRFIVAKDSISAIENLATLPPQLTATRQTETQNPAVIFMFPGQGSQYVNMGSNLYKDEPVFRQAVDTCAEILQPLLNRDLRELLYPQAENLETSTELLNQTRYTQPALFTIEYALAQLWQSWGILPTAMIGHSIGEFVAACLAGVFSLSDALKLVAARGQLIWDLPAGSMLSVRLPAIEMAKRLPPTLSIAAINSPVLCVVSGATEEIEQLQQKLASEEVVCKLLHTSHAFHSPMMESIVAPFANLVANIQLSPPQTPVVSLVTAEWMTDAQATDPQYWAEHLLKPVRFAEGVQMLWAQNPSYVLLEVGARQTLATLARQQATDRTKQIAIASLENTSVDNADWKFLLQAVGQLWLAGGSIDWHQFSADETRQRIPLPTYPFERQRFWVDPPLHTQTSLPAVPSQPIQPPTYLSNAMPVMPAPRTVRLIPPIIEIIKATAGVEIGAGDEGATFLELGLDSLSLTQVALMLKKKFKVKVTFRQLLEDCSTLTTLADSIDLQLPSDAFPAPVVDTPAPMVNLPIAAAPNPILPPPAQVVHTLIPTINPGSQSTIEAVVQQQLQLMARQLELLSGNVTVPVAPAVQIATAPTHDPVVAPVSPSPNGNGKIAPNGNGNQIIAAEPAIKGPAPGTKISRTIDTSLTLAQQADLAKIIDRYVARTAESKRQAQAHRRYFADPRTVSGFSPLLKEMVYPIVTNRAKGSRLWDEDGNEYIDLANGFGLNFFGWSPDFVTDALKAQLDKGIEIGPQTPLAGKVAKTISQLTGMERVTFCNTGSEAVMAAFRIARTVSGRDLIVIFANAYHGTFDEVLVRAGADQKSLPSAPGIMPTVFENVLVLDYGTPESLEIIRNCAEDLAAVIVEPVQSRHPALQPREFLHELRKITEQSETALIFDEVVNGFRVAPGGAQEYFGVRADIATYGKVIGGGLPIGILTGSAKYMDALDGGFWQYGDRSIPEVGVTFFAGTFVRHPLALAAVEAVLDKLQTGGPELQISLTNKVTQLVEQLTEHFQLVGVPAKIEHFSSWFYLTFPATENHAGLLFYLLREKGIHIWEYRPCFLTLAHSDADIDRIIWTFKVCIAELQAMNFLSSAGNAIAINQNLPPQPGAKLGKDRSGNPAWFIADPQQPGSYLQVCESVN